MTWAQRVSEHMEGEEGQTNVTSEFEEVSHGLSGSLRRWRIKLGTLGAQSGAVPGKTLKWRRYPKSEGDVF